MRSRQVIAGAAAITIAAGLATRRFPALFPEIVARYGGDVLWAATAYGLVAFLRPRATSLSIASIALAIAVFVELSQLIQWGWMESLRSTSPGALVLGRGFLMSDLLCYFVGVALAFAVDRFSRRQRVVSA